jgi:RHS repeat-associated protein
LGRVAATSNPYREGDVKYWSKPRYDELNRVVETYAPAIEGQTGASLGITEFGISTVQDFVGTYTTATDASGRRARSITNALGQLIRIDEPTGNNDLGLIGSPNQPTFYKYNPQGKMVKVSQGQQNRYFLYDYLGRLIRVKQPEQEVNSLLNTTQTVDGNNEWTAKMEYDLVGNLVKTTDAEGKTITNFYDKASRVIRREYSNLDTPTVFYHYDGTGLGAVPAYSKGKLTKVSSTISATQYTSFDNFGRTLVSQQLTDGQTYESKYKYNLSGGLIEQTYPSGKVVRNFLESDGDLGKIVRNGKVYASDMSYTSAGILERIKLGNGLWESAKMNARQQVEEINLGTSPTDGSKWQVKYEYGELSGNGTIQNTGNITKQTINFAGLAQPFVQTYKYDALDRIVEAKENNGTAMGTQNWKQTYDYDRFGNRISFSLLENGKTAITTTPQIDPNKNRFVLGQGFEYDKSGNITKDTSTGITREFVFNGDNKQVHVKDASGAAIGTYFYDGEGKRVKKTTTSEITIFVYDGGGKLVAEYSTAAPPANPTVSYTATDPLGSPRVITDKNGNVISRRDFMPFGEELNANNATNRLDTQKYNFGEDNVRKRFTGYEKDLETGLDFAEARYYNNKYARFTAVDPLLASGKSSNPQTYNRYVYVANRPLVKIDPDGMQTASLKKAELGPRRIIDVFIGLRTEVKFADGSTSVEREKSFDMDKHWNELQKTAKENNITLNVYRFDDQTATTDRLLQSLKAKDREVIFTGHTWTDPRANGTSNLGILTQKNNDGTAAGSIGTLGVSKVVKDSNGNPVSKDSKIPKFNAHIFMLFTCRPDSDFRQTLQRNMPSNSLIYYNTGGADTETEVNINEIAAFTATATLVNGGSISNAVIEANKVLATPQTPFNTDPNDVDKLTRIKPKPKP